MNAVGHQMVRHKRWKMGIRINVCGVIRTLPSCLLRTFFAITVNACLSCDGIIYDK